MSRSGQSGGNVSRAVAAVEGGRMTAVQASLKYGVAPSTVTHRVAARRVGRLLEGAGVDCSAVAFRTLRHMSPLVKYGPDVYVPVGKAAALALLSSKGVIALSREVVAAGDHRGRLAAVREWLRSAREKARGRGRS